MSAHKKHVGPVMAASFQTVAYGVFSNIDEILKTDAASVWLKNKIQALYKEDTFKKNTTPGVQSIPRYKDLSLFGAKFFRP